MKKIFVSTIIFLSLLSCGEYEDFSAEVYEEDTMEKTLLTEICREAYDTHVWMAEENACMEYGCCWEYVSADLRAKYERGERLSVAEMKDVLSGLETCPSYWDTLGENGARIDYDYYLEYGLEWFEPNHGYTDEDLDEEEE